MKRKTLISTICFFTALIFCLSAAQADGQTLETTLTAISESSTDECTPTDTLPETTVPESTTANESTRNLPIGDTDEDGEVTINDSRKLLRCAVGLEEVPEEKLRQWDIWEDGVINVSDARAALRVAVGLPIAYTEPEIPEESTAPAVPEEPTNPAVPEEPTKPTVEEYVKLLADSIDKGNLNANMKMLCSDVGSRYTGLKGEQKAREAICKKLESYGYTPKFQNVSVGTKKLPSKNIIVTIPTKKSSPDIYLFSAHYDCSSRSVGAVDNASGVSALLELARALKSKNTDFGCEIRIAFFAGEEDGYYGAYRYRRSMSDSERSRHKIFFNVDMAGHSTDSNKNYLCVSTEPVIKTYSPTKKTAYDNLGSNAVRTAHDIIGSCGEDGFYAPVSAGQHDIVPFRKAGLPSLTLSWREISSSRGSQNDYNLATPAVIHTSADNLSNFDSESLYKTSRLIAASFAVMTYGYIY